MVIVAVAPVTFVAIILLILLIVFTAGVRAVQSVPVFVTVIAVFGTVCELFTE